MELLGFLDATDAGRYMQLSLMFLVLETWRVFPAATRTLCALMDRQRQPGQGFARIGVFELEPVSVCFSF